VHRVPVGKRAIVAHPRRLIVKFRPGVAAQSSSKALSRAGVRTLKRMRTPRLRTVEVRDKRRRIDEVLAELRRQPGVEYAEPDYRVHVDAQFPDDPRFGELWGLHNTGQSGGTADADVDAPEAWSQTTGDSSLVVGVIDTGVDYTHEDLAANMWRNPGETENGLDDDGNGYVDDVFGVNCITGTGDPFDDHYHGTHVAGTIGAVGDNGIGVAGMSWNVRIMALKFLDSEGGGWTSDAIECLEYATAMRANGVNVRLTSNSWGGGGFSQALEDAIRASGQAGMLFVVAAGNDGIDIDLEPDYPASYDLDSMISVAATDRNDALASFSNFGVTSVDLAAPGVSILSTSPGSGYRLLQGTSMATPHVSGAAALVWSRHPSASAAGVRSLLLASTDPLASVAGQVATSGRLNAASAMCAPGDHRLALLPGDGFRAATTQPNRIEALLLDCVAPILGASVDLSFSNAAAPLALLDNGVAPDSVANDGIYTGSWNAEGTGEVALTAGASFPGGSLEHSVTWYLPDYLVSDDVPFDWVDTTAGAASGVTGDDHSARISLGFDFEFYGATHDAVTVSSNGYLTFGFSGSSYYNERIPNAAQPSDLIAVYWDDLNPSSGGEVVYLLEGSAPSRSLTVEWRGVRYFGSSGAATFQATLYEADGRIVLRYLDVVSGNASHDRGVSASVGIEDATGQRGIQYSHNESAISNGMAIEFSLPVISLCADQDGDAICDTGDLCPYVSDPGQEDTGGTGGGLPDGIGDACQCGDVTGDGRITLADFVEIRQFVASGGTVLPSPSFVSDKCDVSGDQQCSLADFVRVRRAVSAGTNHHPLIEPSCPAAIP
jgi:subtilisin family serine protease